MARLDLTLPGCGNESDSEAGMECWFEEVFGFAEGEEHAETQRMLLEQYDRSRDTLNGKAVGEFGTPSVAELRSRALSTGASLLRDKPLTLRNVAGDVSELFVQPQNRGAFFQAASQFNCLESPDADTTPDEGITGYCWDRTQGPVCAMACAAAAAYRNYLVPVAGERGQTADRQIDNLSDVHAALGGDVWAVRNGYVDSTKEGLSKVAELLRKADRATLDRLRDKIRIGVHYGCQVTANTAPPNHLVGQALCAAAAVGYSDRPPSEWEPLARLILEAAYEATLWAAVVYASRTGTKRMTVYLTKVGGGVFGNEASWIIAAIRRACEVIRGARVGLDVRVVHYGYIEQEYSLLKEVEVSTRLAFGRLAAPEDVLSPEELERQLGQTGVFEGRDANGGWWPVTVVHRTGMKTFSAEVADRHHTKWPRVHVMNIRRRVRSTPGMGPTHRSGLGSTARCATFRESSGCSTPSASPGTAALAASASHGVNGSMNAGSDGVTSPAPGQQSAVPGRTPPAGGTIRSEVGETVMLSRRGTDFGGTLRRGSAQRPFGRRSTEPPLTPGKSVGMWARSPSPFFGADDGAILTATATDVAANRCTDHCYTCAAHFAFTSRRFRCGRCGTTVCNSCVDQAAPATVGTRLCVFCRAVADKDVEPEECE
eukprot:TRINITY_DN5639_c0_g1_i1.p1 TRINITY_DN5639_c0_g1~~TRINITY_DN5639_c0_g1_i1.p1  ORF type:complete len:656 (+),score=196.61 TRINITY_DN5639_c0_g1_i1:180-2147(+)